MTDTQFEIAGRSWIHRMNLPGRNGDIVRAKMAGETLQEIGERYGISRERVRQIVELHWPNFADDGGQSIHKPRTWLVGDVTKTGCVVIGRTPTGVRFRCHCGKEFPRKAPLVNSDTVECRPCVLKRIADRTRIASADDVAADWLSGMPVVEIKRKYGYSTTKSIYDNLERAGIDTSQGRPNGQTWKPDDPRRKKVQNV